MKDRISTFDWDNFQKLHDLGKSIRTLSVDLQISISSIRRARKKGLIVFRKQPNPATLPEIKKRISQSRKKWLSENRDKHPWRKVGKFKSQPCEVFKEELRKMGVFFEEEVCVSQDHNYSVDVLISKRNLIIEVNGNQHYTREGELRPYYQRRHDHLKSLGFTIIELHYSLVYNLDLIKSLLNDPNPQSGVIPFKKSQV